ncbi:male sterility protein [Sarocladium implicatum]|nr:male sterility protein [Sarocladium implicatum]
MAPPSTMPATGIAGVEKPINQTTTTVESVDIEVQDDSTIKTVDELLRRRARANPDQVIISYPSTGINYVDYTLQQLDVFAFRVANYYQTIIPARKSSKEKPITVALLGPSNFEYLVTLLALFKLGHTCLFLSTRISQAAVDNLIDVTDAKYFIVDPRYAKTAEASKETFPHIGIFDIAATASFDFPIEVHADTKMDYHLDPDVETENMTYIIHSSGSTGLPKPIYQRQKACLINFSNVMNLRGFITLPLYHNHGIGNMFRAIYSQKALHLYNADLPLTHDHLVKVMQENNFEIFYGVPFALKLLSESEDGIRVLQNLKIVMYGGSACPDDLGDMLVERGVNLVGHYGSTETGQLMTSFRPPGDKAWNYVREHPKLTPYLRWIPQGPNLFECCVLEGWPAKVATNMEDGSYATKDLMEPHPTIPGAWKYIARRDDTINLVNGEMFNPVSTEGTIRSSKLVTEAVIFGAGRDALGALIIPAEALTGKTEEEQLEEIWPIVESACASVEAYARIAKDMIKLLPIGCEYPRTDKGSIIRQAFYRTYEADINEMYDRLEGGSADQKKLSHAELHDFIRVLVAKVLSKPVEMTDETDFFAVGLDSLQAIRIRSDIIKNIDVGGAKLGQTVVFDHPSVSKLAGYLNALSSGEQASKELSIEDEMQELINKYSIIPAPPTEPRSSIVITGVTGSLGAHIVAKMVSDPTIDKIYCLTRAKSDEDASRRIMSSLIQRKVYHGLTLSQRRKLISLSSELSDARLGLSSDTYRQIRQSLRTVIHCAWSVNFNMRLSSFENSNIAGVAHLISLCRAAGGGASFNFCSSVSVVSRATTVPVPESLPEMEWAQGMGYAQSKCVAENICLRAAEDRSGSVPTRVLRLGQIISDTEHGVWNATEGIPLMIQTALTVGALPRLEETPSWLPVDVIAQAVADISLSDAEGSVFTNVTNPKYFHWTKDLLPALRAAGLEFEEVSPKEWVRRLRASNPDPEVNPPIKLVDFFAGKYDKDEFAPSKTYATEKACALSPALASAAVLDQDLVYKFVSYFMNGPWAVAIKKAQELSSVTQLASCVEAKQVIVLTGYVESTVATILASNSGLPLLESSSLCSKAAVEKLQTLGILPDEELSNWFGRVASRATETIDDLGHDGVVIAANHCPRNARDALRSAISREKTLIFIDLQSGDEQLRAEVSETDIVPVDAEADTREVVERIRVAIEEASA